MKIRYKKTWISVTAAAMAGVLAAGTFLQSTQVDVQASLTQPLPGIETIVNETTEEDPFRILEIVDSGSDAEIGYYVSGQEPYLKLYCYSYESTDEDGNTQTEYLTFRTVEEALGKLPTQAQRRAFMENVALDEDGNLVVDENGDITAASNLLGRSLINNTEIVYDVSGTEVDDNASDTYPVTYEEYQEKYYFADGEDTQEWTSVTLSETQEVTAWGKFVENAAGTGNYTKEESVYTPIRETTDADGNVTGQEEVSDSDAYRENIESFNYSEGSSASSPYSLEFEEVGNDLINKAIASAQNSFDDSSSEETQQAAEAKAAIEEEYDYEDGHFGLYENVYTDLTEELRDAISGGEYTFPGEAQTYKIESETTVTTTPTPTPTPSPTPTQAPGVLLIDSSDSSDLAKLGKASPDSFDDDHSESESETAETAESESETAASDSWSSGESVQEVIPETDTSAESDPFSSGEESAVFEEAVEDCNAGTDESGELVDMMTDPVAENGESLSADAVSPEDFADAAAPVGVSQEDAVGADLFSDSTDAQAATETQEAATAATTAQEAATAATTAQEATTAATTAQEKTTAAQEETTAAASSDVIEIIPEDTVETTGGSTTESVPGGQTQTETEPSTVAETVSSDLTAEEPTEEISAETVLSGDEIAEADPAADSGNEDTANERFSEEAGGRIWNAATAGTQANPYVYVAKQTEVYPYYIYEGVCDLKYLTESREVIDPSQDTQYSRQEGDITLEDGQYWICVENEDGSLSAEPLCIVAGLQPVSYDVVIANALPDDLGYNYYFRVNKVYFCCGSEANADSETGYYGWYYANYPDDEEDIYKLWTKDGGEEVYLCPTHYISNISYRLTEGTGTYDFVQGTDTAQGYSEQEIEVNRIWYKGGYKSTDWLEKYVFHQETDDTSENLKMEVVTLSAKQFEELYAGLAGTDETAETSLFSDDTETLAVGDGSAEDAESFSDDSGTLYTEISDSGSGTVTEGTDGSAGAETTLVDISGQAEAVFADEAEEGFAEVITDAEETAAVSAGAEEAKTGGTVLSTTDLDIDDLLTANTDLAGYTDLDSYDLIYVNGCVSGTSMKYILDFKYSDGNSIPVIINQAKVEKKASETDSTSGVEMKQALSDAGVLKTEDSTDENYDADGHYVNGRLYFFKNKGADGKTDDTTYGSWLLNPYFNSYFSTADIEEDTVLGGDDVRQGFEEILEYIASENQYRGIGTAAEAESDTETTTETTETAETTAEATEEAAAESTTGIELLSCELSQARAIEYILNYSYKRIIKAKDTIQVLEIEPANSSGKLTQNDVWKWLGYSETEIAATENALGTENGLTFTSCCYNTNNGENNPISFALDGDNSTFWISDWKNGHESKKTGVSEYCSGKAHYIRISGIPDNAAVSGISYTPRNDTSSISGSAVWLRVYIYDKNGQELKYYDYEDLSVKQEEKKLNFNKIYYGNNISKIDVVFMESYVGKTLTKASNAGSSAGTYASCAEIRVFGTISDGENQDTATTLPTIEITTMTASEFVGHIEDLNTEYDLIYIGDDDSFRRSSSNTVYDKSGTKYADYIMGKAPMLYTHVGAAGYGYYPEISGTSFVKLMGLLDIDYETIEGGAKNRIRNRSLYNTGEGTIPEGSTAGLGSFRGSGNDITKQQYNALMDFVKSGYPVVLADQLVSSSGKVNEETVDNSSWYYQFMSGALSMDNVVTVSEAESDGIHFYANLAKPVIQFESKPPEPSTGEGNVLTGVLTADTDGLEYTFTIENDSEVLPASASYDCKLYLDLNFDGNFGTDEDQQEYIEIVEAESGSVLTAQDGKYQLKVGKKYTLTRKIPKDYYKIMEWKLEVVSNTNTSVRTSEIGYAKRDSSNLSVDDIQDINVLQIIPTARKTWSLQNDSELKTYLTYVKNNYGFDINIQTITISAYEKDAESYLKDKQMVILGFADAYSNISNEDGQVDKLVEFAKSGKSVIFSHDTTSSVNIDLTKTENMTAEKERVDNPWLSNNNAQDAGLSLNTYFRFIAGLDRYGILDTGDSFTEDSSSMSVSALLKRGEELTDKSTIEGSEKGDGGTVSFERLMKLVGDVAFKAGSSRTTSYLQTQGYTNVQLQSTNAGSYLAKKVTQVNEGIITNYPYKITGEDGILNVNSTHAQSYQLALEEDRDINGNSDGVNDIVVWYCLSGDDEYTKSPNDVRNNYYFYSKGNVIYTGAGHSEPTKEEKKLFVNAMVAAANVIAVEPEVDFVSELSPTADTQSVTYYMTDQTLSTAGTVNVVDNSLTFYFNVRDYNMVSSSLSSEGSKTLTAEFYIESDAGETEATIGGETVKLKKLYGSDIEDLSSYTSLGSGEGSAISQTDGVYTLPSNDAYSLTISNVEQYVTNEDGTYKENVKLYVRVTSTVMLYGSPETQSSWASISLKQRQLFDLD